MDIEKFIREARPALVIELRKHAKAPTGPLVPQEEMILGCVECAMRLVMNHCAPFDSNFPEEPE